MNNFVNEALLALHHKRSLALCLPSDPQHPWERYYESAGVPICRKCSDDSGAAQRTMFEVVALLNSGQLSRASLLEVKLPAYERLFRPNAALLSAIAAAEQSLGLQTGKYIGVHVRRGDKASEAAPVSSMGYVWKLRELLQGSPNLDTVFVASDDDRSLVRLKGKLGKLGDLGRAIKFVEQPRLPDYAYKARGAHYNSKSSRFLLVDLELLVRAHTFVGTASSNLGRFVFFRRNGRTCHSLDDHGDFLARPG